MLNWAIGAGMYAIDQSAALRKNAEEFADILRTETVKDDDGQEVRVNHAYGTEQGHFWEDGLLSPSSSELEQQIAPPPPAPRGKLFGAFGGFLCRLLGGHHSVAGRFG